VYARDVQVLQPAIELAEDGFPVSPVTAHQWRGCFSQLIRAGGPGVSRKMTRNHDMCTLCWGGVCLRLFTESRLPVARMGLRMLQHGLVLLLGRQRR
jgi:hypothetical protein